MTGTAIADPTDLPYRHSRWRMRRGRLGWCAFMPKSGISILTRLECCRLYAPVDAPDRESCRPDFAVALYPGHLWTEENFELNPLIRVTRQTPPTFLLQAENDPTDPVQNSLAYWAALKQAGVPVEMHLYAEGGHAFGLRRTEFPITEWPKLVERWLLTIGITPQ